LVNTESTLLQVSVSDGKSRAQPSRLKLCSEYLVLQREEFTIWDDEDSYPVEAGLRLVEKSSLYMRGGEKLPRSVRPQVSREKLSLPERRTTAPWESN
jgi:hypothetical protein